MQEYFVDVLGFRKPVDVLPYLRDAISRCRYKHDFTIEELAPLLEKQVQGKYVPVDVLNRIEDRMLDAITGWAIKRIQNEYRMAQILDPETLSYAKYLHINYFDDRPCCQAVRPLLNRWLSPSEIVPLPLDACDEVSCSCIYSGISERRALRLHPEWSNYDCAAAGDANT